MKKFGLFLFSLYVLMLSGGGGVFAFASTLEQPINLIEPLLLQSADGYGISSDEISTSTPIDEDNNKAMVGYSICPNADDNNQFEKTLAISLTEIKEGNSLYIYIFFGNSDYLHNLEVSLSDGGDNFIIWQVSSETLAMQVKHSSDSSNLRYGWQLLELPISCSTQSGEFSNATIMTVKYTSQNVSKNNYAKCMFYAPYMQSSQNSDISFSNKQNYYNFKINWGENIDKYFLGDKYTITSWNNMFYYCIIGDLDLLEISTNLYRFVFEVIDKNGDIQSTDMFSNNFEAQFNTEGTYTLRVTLYDSNGNWLWKHPDKQIEIGQFVAIYLSDSLKGLNQNSKYIFNININNSVQQYTDIVIENSNDEVANVYASDGKLYVETKDTGTSTVKISLYASRVNADEDNYSYEYSLSVEKNGGFPWVSIILGSISLLIIGILVYIIMVKRRLITGKYPKY